MTDHPLLTFWLGAVLGYAPATLAALVICLWTLVRREQLRAAWPWAPLGSGLLVLANLLAPVTHFQLQQRIITHYESAERYGMLNLILNLVWSSVYAAAYVCLAVAIFAGRRRADAGTPPPLPAAKIF